MIKGYQELNRLGDLLEAELDGRHFDSDEVNRLASAIAQLYPGISGTLSRMLERQRDSAKRAA
ncbi:MAG TPA: hypothetical protein VM661_08580 [Candidatus Sulfotelmatobacter sp.]|jgi:hypothetical protein|nr:hypothetical protein [Candidatus Sulfotelmatobacter sp.]